jgi:hypothetical protein
MDNIAPRNAAAEAEPSSRASAWARLVADLDDLRVAEANYQTTSRLAETARMLRNAAVRAALADGCTHTQIAAATGLTRGRIGQIAAARDAAPQDLH